MKFSFHSNYNLIRYQHQTVKVLIITGGTSSERKISFISARSVKQALEKNSHKVKIFDLKKGYQELKKLVADFDVIFPVIHGEEGEGGTLYKFLFKLGKPFVGGDYKGFKTGWYKIPFKKFCDKNNIPTAKWRQIKAKEQIIQFGFPCVLKSSSGGSSREVIILKSRYDLNKKTCQNLLKSGMELFVEVYLPGVEITVGILNNQALPVIEISPPKGEWFDYKNKYSGATREIPHAPSVSKSIQSQAQRTALFIHQTLKLGHYSRIDFIVSGLYVHPKGVNIIPYVLEVNTIPGLTFESLFPKAAKFEQLVEKLINLATQGHAF